MANEENGESSASWKSPFGQIKVTGTLVLIVVLELACTYLLFWSLMKHDERAEIRNAEFTKSIVSALTENSDLLEGTLFMLSKTPTEREKYHLNVPRSVRDRMIRER